MYPTLFRIGTFEITSFGGLVALGTLVGLWLFARECRRSQLPEHAVNAAVGGAIGGLAGAKLIWTLEFLGTAPWPDLLFSRGGLSWFGGLAGGLAVGLTMLRRARVPIIGALAAAAPGLAMGHAIGRIGCFLVGDDYGKPSSLPWAVAFPRGLPPTLEPVHPTQLYETAALLVVTWLLLRWRSRRLDDARVLGNYFVLAGLIRFAIEFLRINARILGPLTLAQVWSLLAVGVGIGLTARPLRRRD